MMVADVFVVFDTVQFNPRHEENRAKIKGPNGLQWLTVPVVKSGRDQVIVDTQLRVDEAWREKAMLTLQGFYGKSPNYRDHESVVRSLLEAEYETLTELDIASWQPALEPLGISCRFVRASELPVTGHGPDLLLDLCQHVGATTYLSGAFGAEYLDVAKFESRGVDVRFHGYDYPSYDQRFGEFAPYASYLDLWFNAGLDREFVASGGRVTREP